MALQDIIKEIEREKEEKIKEIEKEKEGEILELKRKYEKEIEEKRNQILKEKEEELKKEIFKKKEELKRRRQISILKEKRKILAEVQKMAFEEMKKMDEKTEKEVLKKLMERAVLETEGIPDSEIEIIPACQKEKLVREILKELQKKYSFSDDCLKSVGGFVLKTKEFVINYTFESLFERIKEETEIKVAKILFE